MSQTYVMARAGAYDVIVVGGRIAGSLTAMQLARRARQAEALADCLSAESPDWATDYADARDAVTAERFSMTVTHMPDLRTLMT